MTALANANKAMNAIRLAAMFATNAMDCDAPAAAASSKFEYFLLRHKQADVTCWNEMQ